MKTTLFTAPPQAVIRTPYAPEQWRKDSVRELFPAASLILEVLETLLADD